MLRTTMEWTTDPKKSNNIPQNLNTCKSNIVIWYSYWEKFFRLEKSCYKGETVTRKKTFISHKKVVQTHTGTADIHTFLWVIRCTTKKYHPFFFRWFSKFSLGLLAARGGGGCWKESELTFVYYSNKSCPNSIIIQVAYLILMITPYDVNPLY